jgi:DNA-binding NtrC family response regulator
MDRLTVMDDQPMLETETPVAARPVVEISDCLTSGNLLLSFTRFAVSARCEARERISPARMPDAGWPEKEFPLSSESPSKLRVLFVDDESPIREVMRIELPRMGHEATICEDGAAALQAIEKTAFDAAIIDLKMPGITGWEVVERLREVSPETDVVISTGHGNMDAAIQALRQGAYDFLPKPCQLFEIANVLGRIADKKALANKTIALESRLQAIEGSARIVGESASIQRVLTLTEKIAPTESSVLVLGETGTGKELVARRVHELSLRVAGPFVAVNCGALPDNLVESELFGHRKGAFTGAETSRKGLIEVADGGTLFLDELGELDKAMQVKLLRFLESGEVRRLGESEPFHVDVRVVCATNRDLQDMVAEGGFREDLYYRVNTFEIHLASLRERKQDIPELARCLVARCLKRPEMPTGMLTPEALESLIAYDWPGNIRELANALEHAVILCADQTITRDDLPVTVTRDRQRQAGGFSLAALPNSMTLREIEMQVILQTLDRHEGDKPRTAADLGIALKTLYNKLNQYRIQRMAG